jgi:dTDP-4-dehydrorhamnose reductase
MNINILILGDGFIGKNLFDVISLSYQTTLTNRNMLDVTSKKSIEEFFLLNNKYTHIIYAVGIKDVNYCEKNPDDAFLVNAEGVKNILQCYQPKKFIYISTDYVFDGLKGFYTENDISNPQTIYGKSKLLGENYTSHFSKNNLVIRTSGVYGKDCGWLQWLLESYKKETISCFEDVYNSPTYVINLADMIIDMIKIDYYGIINLCGPESLNRYQLYSIVFEQYNIIKDKLSRGVSSGIIPKNISLDNSLYTRLTNKSSTKAKDGFKILPSTEK